MSVETRIEQKISILEKNINEKIAIINKKFKDFKELFTKSIEEHGKVHRTQIHNQIFDYRDNTLKILRIIESHITDKEKVVENLKIIHNIRNSLILDNNKSFWRTAVDKAIKYVNYLYYDFNVNENQIEQIFDIKNRLENLKT